MNVLVDEMPPLLAGGRPYSYCRCDRCEAAMSFAWPESAAKWKTRHERECKGAASVLAARSP